jgi:rubrerythrin
MPHFETPFAGNSLGRKMTRDEIVRALRIAIAAEYEAVQMYQQIAEATTDETAKKVMLSVAREEIVHAGEILEVLLLLSPDEATAYEEGSKEVRDMVKEAGSAE